MNVTVETTGLERVRARLLAVGQARRYVGEVYIEGERNQKLATIHEGGAILRAGAATRIRPQRAARPGRDVDRPQAGAFRHVGHGGQIPARNFLFIQTGDGQRIRNKIERGIRAILASGSGSAFGVVMQACADLAAESMRANVVGRGPGAAGGGHRVGLAEDPGKRMGHGRKMTALVPGYKREKEKRVGPSPILVRTGEMVRSVKARVVEEGA